MYVAYSADVRFPLIRSFVTDPCHCYQDGTTNLITRALAAVGRSIESIPDPTQIHYRLPRSVAHPLVSHQPHSSRYMLQQALYCTVHSMILLCSGVMHRTLQAPHSHMPHLSVPKTLCIDA